MRRHLTAARGWAVLGTLVAVYEAIAPEDHLLSEGVDRALIRAPRLTRLAIVVTCAHLLNILPEATDPYYQLARLAGFVHLAVSSR